MRFEFLRRGWTGWLLVVSLAVNFAIVGLLGGAMWRAHSGFGPHGGLHNGPHGVHGGVRHGGYARPYIAALPRAERRAMLRDLHAGRDAAPDLPDRAAMRAQYDAVLIALRAAPFDASALRGALDMQAQSASAFERAAQEAWLRQVLPLDAQARADYADRVEALLAHYDRRRAGGKGARGGDGAAITPQGGSE